MMKVEKAYSVFFKLWNVSMIPKLLKMNKWFDSKAQLQVGDLVYFRKEESELSSTWTVGKVSEIVKSKDGLVRRATVQYSNSTEDFPRFTDRAVRSLIKLFHVDGENWQADMDQVEKLIAVIKGDKSDDLGQAYTMSHTGEGLRFRLTATSGYDGPQRELGVQHRLPAKVARSKLLKSCELCCCSSHCLLTGHGKEDILLKVPAYEGLQKYKYQNLLDRSWMEFDDYQEVMYSCPFEQDKFMSVLCAVGIDLGDDVDDPCPGSDNFMI